MQYYLMVNIMSIELKDGEVLFPNRRDYIKVEGILINPPKDGFKYGKSSYIFSYGRIVNISGDGIRVYKNKEGLHIIITHEFTLDSDGPEIEIKVK
jgi:hypothetical protein